MYGGIFDKYIGDDFLAFFERSPDPSGAAQRAVDAARVMQRAFRNLWAGASAEVGDILVSQSAHQLLDNEDDAKVTGLTKLRGRREPMNVFRRRSDKRDS